MPENTENKIHTSPNYGGYLGHKIFHLTIAYLGVTPAYILLAFVVPYYVLVRHRARKSASYYLKRRFPRDNFLIRFLRTVKYFYRFGQVLIDQAVTGIMGEEYVNFEFPKGEELLRKINDKHGVVLLTSHLGNWQTAMSTMGEFGYSVYFHFQLEEHTSGRHFFDLAGKRDKFKIIPPSGFLGGMVEITNILNSGGCVAIMGDRAWGGKTRKMNFLGKEALFPVTPYFLSSVTGAEIFMIMPVRTGKLSFRIESVGLTDGLDLKSLDREEAVEMLMGKYVRNLEDNLEKHPYMWFNFYDFWSEKDETAMQFRK